MQEKDNSQEIYGVKIDVRRRGCNGYSYVMDYVKEEQIGKLWSGNLLRVWADVEKVAKQIQASSK